MTLYDAVIVSDLHLRTGPCDDFRFDAQFEDFLQQMHHDGCRELILNGDIFEFVAMWPESTHHPDPSLGFTEAESVARIVAIGLEHARFFEALRKFICDGGRCVFLPGNHDWDLHWPGVQRHLQSLLGTDDPDKVEFVLHGHPYKPLWGSLHVEHGHQLVTDQNFFRFPDQPIRKDPHGGVARIEQSVGNWLVRSLVNPLEAHFPFITNVRPFMKIRWIAPDRHALKLASVLPEAVVNTLKDGRITPRLLDIVTTSPPLRGIFGFGRSMRLILHQGLRHRVERVSPDVSSVFNDDASIPMRQAARRHLQLFHRTRFIVMGHSHEVIDENHDFNHFFSRRKRGYLNPGSWTPCKEIPEDQEALPIEHLLAGTHYPYQLNFARVRALRHEQDLEARCETFEEGAVWMEAA